MSRLFDIVGYTYNADQYGPECIVKQVMVRTQTPCESVDNSGNPVSGAESSLDELAEDLGIDREDEKSYDSGDFPKVIFRDQLSDRPGDGTEPNRCGNCGKELGEN